MFTHTLIGILFALMTTLPLAWKWQLGVRRMALLVAFKEETQMPYQKEVLVTER